MMMMMPRWNKLGAVVFCTACLIAPAHIARADQKQECLDAYDQAQTLRQDGKLAAARKKMLVCAQPYCSDFMQRDCTKWIGEVDADMPTVVFSAKDSKGQDMLDVAVTVDDELLVSQIDGKAVSVDPGVHVFRFTSDGKRPVEERVVVLAGAKNRAISVILAPLSDDDSLDGSFDSGSVKRTSSAAPPPLTYVFGGVGLLGVGGMIGFGLSFKSKVSDLDNCKPSCEQSKVDSASTMRTLAFVSGGVGLVGLGLGTYFWVAKATKKEPVSESASAGPRFDLVPIQGGAFGTLHTTF